MLDIKALLQKMVTNTAPASYLSPFPSLSSFIVQKYGLAAATYNMSLRSNYGTVTTTSMPQISSVYSGRTYATDKYCFHFLGVKYTDGLYLVFVSGVVDPDASYTARTYVAYQGSGYSTRQAFEFSIPSNISAQFSGQANLIILGTHYLSTTIAMTPYVYQSGTTYSIRATVTSAKNQGDEAGMNFIIACLPTS